MDSRTSFSSSNGIGQIRPQFHSGQPLPYNNNQLAQQGMYHIPPFPGVMPCPTSMGPPMMYPVPQPPGLPFPMQPQLPLLNIPRPFLPLGAVPPPPPAPSPSPSSPPPSHSMQHHQPLQRIPSSSSPTKSTHTPRIQRSISHRAPSASSQRPSSASSTIQDTIHHATSPTTSSPTASAFSSTPMRRNTPSSARSRTSSPRPDSAVHNSSSLQLHRNPSSSHRRTFSANKTAPKTLSVPTTTLSETDNIKVAVRVRPLNAVEIERGDLCTISVDLSDTAGQVHLTLPAPTSPLSSPSRASSLHHGSSPSITRSFPFHACLGPETSQADVIKLCGVFQLLDAALDGYNATIFAYGQTGSGKTYTINGYEEDGEESGSPTSPKEDDGIVPRSLAYIFSQVQARNAALKAPQQGINGSSVSASDGCLYSVRVSYCEIYNEALYDLVNFDQRQLAIRWDPSRGFHAPDLHVQECPTLEDARAVIVCGLGHRRVGSHNLNLESSRSHSLLTVHIDAVPQLPEAPDFGTTRMGKVVFVDLAGSERLKDSQSAGDAIKETASINRSLFMLGKVISALASGAKGALVPYRESKLTKLLMDSLGGTALSLMIACCSPSSMHADETLSTLSYATRAKNICNVPIVQVDPREAATAALRREIKLLRTENAYLREQLALSSQPRQLYPSVSGDHVATTPPPSSALSDSPGGSRMSPSPSPLPAHSILLPVPSSSALAEQASLSKQLGDAQRLLSTLSTENARLAGENERLRAGGLQVSSDYCGAVEEVEWLRGKLAKLEATLVGLHVPSVANDSPLHPSKEEEHSDHRENENKDNSKDTESPESMIHDNLDSELKEDVLSMIKKEIQEISAITPFDGSEDGDRSSNSVL